MLISRNHKNEGVCFAWTPKHVPEGVVWLEWVHYRFIDSGFGGWEYARWIPASDWQREQDKLLSECALHSHYETPPDKSKCRNLRSEGPTPCWYPHCTCMIIGGSVCGTLDRPLEVDAEKGR